MHSWIFSWRRALNIPVSLNKCIHCNQLDKNLSTALLKKSCLLKNTCIDLFYQSRLYLLTSWCYIKLMTSIVYALLTQHHSARCTNVQSNIELKTLFNSTLVITILIIMLLFNQINRMKALRWTGRRPTLEGEIEITFLTHPLCYCKTSEIVDLNLHTLSFICYLISI